MPRIPDNSNYNYDSYLGKNKINREPSDYKNGNNRNPVSDNSQQDLYNQSSQDQNTWSYGFPAISNAGFGIVIGQGSLNTDTGIFSGNTQINIGFGAVSVNPYSYGGGGGGHANLFNTENTGLGFNINIMF